MGARFETTLETFVQFLRRMLAREPTTKPTVRHHHSSSILRKFSLYLVLELYVSSEG